MAIKTPSPSIFRPQQRHRPERARREPQADRGDRSPQDPARRGQPRRADDADRLQRHRPRRGAERAARGVGVQRRRAGVPVQSEQARADLYARRRCCKPPRYNAYYEIEEVKPVDVASWKLELAGSIERQAALDRAADLRTAGAGIDHPPHLRRGLGLYRPVVGREPQAVPGARRRRPHRQIRRCSAAPTTIRASSTWRPRCIRRPSWRPNTPSEPITDPFGFPLRLRTATKLGFKNPKWITSIEVTNTYPGGYWEDRGFNWHSGL